MYRQSCRAFESQLLEERSLSREEAELHARRLFGNRSRLAEETREACVRAWLDRLQQDLRYAAENAVAPRNFRGLLTTKRGYRVGACTPAGRQVARQSRKQR